MGAIALIIVMGLTFPFLLAKSSLNAEIEKLRGEGLPVTPREFADKYYKPIPKAENAADTFDEAYGLYADVDEKDFKKLIVVGIANGPHLDQKIAPVLLNTAQEFIDSNKDLLTKMNELRKYDHIHFNYEWEKGYEIPLPRLNKIRNAARIYAVNAELIINQNNPAKAEKLLKEMFHLCKLASQSPFMIGQLVFYACEAITIAGLERGMNTLTFSSGQLEKFEKVCVEHEKYVISQYPYTWKAELTLLLALALINFDVLKSERYFSPYESHQYIRDIPKKWRIAFYYYSGDFFSDLTAQARVIRATIDVPLDIFVKRKPVLDRIMADNKPNYSYLGGNGGFYVHAFNAITRLRCAATACAVERFHLKYKKLPEKLKQLVPEFLERVPLDPFDGKPLRYFHGKFDMQYDVPLTPEKEKEEKEGQEEDPDSMFGSASPSSRGDGELKYKTVTSKKSGFYVYSIGEDLSDDSSLPLWERTRKDILFIVIDKK